MLNRVVLIGRLTKDSDLTYTPTGVAVCKFTLAIDRNYKNAQGERDTDFINCVVYRQTAEFAANYTNKGKMICIEGRIQVRSYTAQDGQKRWVTEVIADNIYPFLGSKDDNQGKESSTSNIGHEVNVDDDFVPF